MSVTFDKLLGLGFLMVLDKTNYLFFSNILPPTDIYKLKRDIVHYRLELSEKQKE